MTDVVRLNINLAPDTAEFLRDAAKYEGRSVTEIVRRAIAVYKFVAYEEAGDIWVENENGTRSKVLLT